MTILQNAWIFTREGFVPQDLLLEEGKIHFLPQGAARTGLYGNARICDLAGLFVVPGFVDIHVHLREPGFSYKESIRTGTMAAAHGGYTAVCAMPNLLPPPSTLEQLQEELEIIERDALVHVYPYGCITRDQSGRGSLSDMEAIAPYVLGFSDDGKGVQDRGLMRAAMERAVRLGKPIVAHCEDEAELRPGGAVHEGDYARHHGHIGISSASEWKQVARDLELVRETGARYHVCHVSSKETVELIRRAKAEGLPVSCETGPHYLMFTDMDLEEDGRWKMNPPIRASSDRAALLAGFRDGTIDCLITDHAPHSEAEKSRGLDGSAFGIVGLESAFPAMFHNMVLRDPECAGGARVDRSPSLAVTALPPNGDGEMPADWKRVLDAGAAGAVSDGKTAGLGAGESGKGAKAMGVLSLWQLVEKMAVKPRELFSLPGPRYIENGEDADLAVLDLRPLYPLDSSRFYSKGRSTLFDGMEVQGEVALTFVGGKLVYSREGGILPKDGSWLRQREGAAEQ